MSREELMHMIQQAGFALTDANLFLDSHPQNRSEERRVGKECASKCRSRWSPYH